MSLYVIWRAQAGSYSYEGVEEIAAYLSTKSDIKCKIAIICGSGLGGIADMLENKTSIDYKDIPKFPVSTGTFSLYQDFNVEVHSLKHLLYL